MNELNLMTLQAHHRPTAQRSCRPTDKRENRFPRAGVFDNRAGGATFRATAERFPAQPISAVRHGRPLDQAGANSRQARKSIFDGNHFQQPSGRELDSDNGN